MAMRMKHIVMMAFMAMMLLMSMTRGEASTAPHINNTYMVRFPEMEFPGAIVRTISRRSHLGCSAACLAQWNECVSLNVRCTGAHHCDCQLLADAALTDGEMTAQPASDYIRPEVQSVHYPDPYTDQYQYHPSGLRDVPEKTAMKFAVKACIDALVLLSSGPLATGNAYEVLLGGWGNTVSLIRPGKQDYSEEHLRIPTPDILDCSEYRRFWVSWSDNEVKLGKGWIVGENEFLSRTFSPFHDINYISYTGYNGVDAHFLTPRF